MGYHWKEEFITLTGLAPLGFLGWSLGCGWIPRIIRFLSSNFNEEVIVNAFQLAGAGYCVEGQRKLDRLGGRMDHGTVYRVKESGE